MTVPHADYTSEELCGETYVAQARPLRTIALEGHSRQDAAKAGNRQTLGFIVSSDRKDCSTARDRGGRFSSTKTS